MEKNNFEADMPLLENLSIKTIKEQVIPYYMKNGIDIDVSSLEFILFESTLKENFSRIFKKKGVCV